MNVHVILIPVALLKSAVKMIHLIILSGLLSSTFAALPGGWKACKKSDPKVNECLKTQIQKALNGLSTGIKELNIAGLDTLALKELDFGLSSGFDFMLNEGTVEGLVNANIISVQSDLWNSLTIQMLVPSVTFHYNYTAHGVLFNNKIQGTGHADMFIKNTHRNISLTFSELEKNGKTYLNVVKVNADEKPEFVKVNIQPFNKPEAYTLMINKIINDNWEFLIEERRKNGNMAGLPLYQQIANSVLSKIPKEEIVVE